MNKPNEDDIERIKKICGVDVGQAVAALRKAGNDADRALRDLFDDARQSGTYASEMKTEQTIQTSQEDPYTPNRKPDGFQKTPVYTVSLDEDEIFPSLDVVSCTGRPAIDPDGQENRRYWYYCLLAKGRADFTYNFTETIQPARTVLSTNRQRTEPLMLHDDSWLFVMVADKEDHNKFVNVLEWHATQDYTISRALIDEHIKHVDGFHLEFVEPKNAKFQRPPEPPALLPEEKEGQAVVSHKAVLEGLIDGKISYKIFLLRCADVSSNVHERAIKMLGKDELSTIQLFDQAIVDKLDAIDKTVYMTTEEKNEHLRRNRRAFFTRLKLWYESKKHPHGLRFHNCTRYELYCVADPRITDSDGHVKVAKSHTENRASTLGAEFQIKVPGLNIGAGANAQRGASDTAQYQLSVPKRVFFELLPGIFNVNLQGRHDVHVYARVGFSIYFVKTFTNVEPNNDYVIGRDLMELHRLAKSLRRDFFPNEWLVGPNDADNKNFRN